MTTPPLRPMTTFDPALACLVHDSLNDAWKPYDPSYAKHLHVQEDGLVEWDGLLLDGWCEGATGLVHRRDRN